MSWFESLPKIVRIILFIPFWGWVFSALNRIFKYVNKKNTVTLVVGIICVIPIIGFVMSIIDLVTTITADKITVLYE
ncbi:MAG: hypothetical protein IJS83_07120 [Acholeplasmatales bacterium]|nr:hypothetical protein [Acholeplasmatales bacterium]